MCFEKKEKKRKKKVETRMKNLVSYLPLSNCHILRLISPCRCISVQAERLSSAPLKKLVYHESFV